MAMQNKIGQLIKSLGITPYRFAKETGINQTTVYSLKNNPHKFPREAVWDRIIATYKVEPNDIVEYSGLADD